MQDFHNHNLNSLSLESGPTRDLWSLPVHQRAREKDDEALKQEPFLTIGQIARLFYSVRRDGQPAKSTRFRPRPNSEYELPPGYHSARALLNRMVRDKELVVF